MSSELLHKARVYETGVDQEVHPEDRPVYHLSPRVGWMNDPNGFSYYNGQYHMFYQYHPYNTMWGPMHWGHAVSRDLLHWEYLPAALAPDTEADQNGCFSGCAVTLPDGRQALVYTGVVNDPQPDGMVPGFQTQCLAIGDGRDYAKLDRNPILDASSLPPGISRYDFRDPKVWQEVDGNYRMLCAVRTEDESDTMLLLFRSRNLTDWQYERIFLQNGALEQPIGRMYECPDFFSLDGQYVLLASAQDIEATQEHAPGNGTFYMVGNYDPTDGSFIPQVEHNVDYGVDFYAEQTVLAPDGRRIMLGWMQNWDTILYRPNPCKWFGQMSVPRELSIRNGRLCQWPIREIDRLRMDPVRYRNVRMGEEIGAPDTIELAGIRGRVMDLEMEISATMGQSDCRRFLVGLAVDETHHVDVIYLPGEGRLLVDRRYSGMRRALAHVSSVRVTSHDGTLRLRILLDRFSAEIFVNDGEQVLSTTFYTAQTADRVTFSSTGAVSFNITKYDLRT